MSDIEERMKHQQKKKSGGLKFMGMCFSSNESQQQSLQEQPHLQKQQYQQYQLHRHQQVPRHPRGIILFHVKIKKE